MHICRRKKEFAFQFSRILGKGNKEVQAKAGSVIITRSEILSGWEKRENKSLGYKTPVTI